jgi:hypothetical protein
MRERLCVGEIIDRDEVEVVHSLELCGAYHLASDPAEAVDPNANCHVDLP